MSKAELIQKASEDLIVVVQNVTKLMNEAEAEIQRKQHSFRVFFTPLPISGLLQTMDDASANAIAATQSLEEIRDEFVTRSSEVLSKLEPIETAADSVASNIQEGIDTVKEAFGDFIASQRDALSASVLQPGADLKDQFVDEITSQIDQRFNQLSELISDRIDRVLRPTISELAQLIDGILDGIVHRLSEGDAEVRQENVVLHSAVEALRPLVDNLMSQFKRVEALAASVGL